MTQPYAHVKPDFSILHFLTPVINKILDTWQLGVEALVVALSAPVPPIPPHAAPADGFSPPTPAALDTGAEHVQEVSQLLGPPHS